MCIAASGKVIEINGSSAKINFNGNIISAEAGLVNINLGDSVLVHAGCIIQVLSNEEKAILDDIISEIESISQEEY